MLLASLSQWDTDIHHWLESAGVPVEQLVRLIVAAILGGMVGLEREFRGREAGLRTYMLVCIGSALAMIVSVQMAIHPWHPQTANQGVNINVDPARIAYSVMTGIGFIGAGVVVHQNGSVRGLTTGAGLWCIAAVGLAAGFGMYLISLMATLLVLGALGVLDYFEHLLPKAHFRTVTLRTAWRPGCIAAAIERFKSAGLRVTEAYFDRDTDPKFASIHVQVSYIRPETYDAFERQIESDPAFDLISVREK